MTRRYKNSESDTLSKDVERFRTEIGRRLRAVRFAANQTQQEFATSIDARQNSYQKWESGALFPDPMALMKVCAPSCSFQLFVWRGFCRHRRKYRSQACAIPCRFKKSLASAAVSIALCQITKYRRQGAKQGQQPGFTQIFKVPTSFSCPWQTSIKSSTSWRAPQKPKVHSNLLKKLYHRINFTFDKYSTIDYLDCIRFQGAAK